MEFSRYLEYKESGVDWPSQVPSHWTVIPAKYKIKTISGGQTTKNLVSNEPLEGLYPAFSASGQDVWMEQYEFDSCGIVLSAVGARCGKTFKADGKWGVVANTHCLFPSSSVNRDFIWYLTNREDWWEKGGTAQPFIKVNNSLSRKIAIPDQSEQEKIVSFLDRETARIDALISEQQMLIELLREKRQTMISDSVIRGLDKNIKMKNSGVEWLGQVPEHWDVKRISNLFSESSEFGEENLPILSVSIHHGVSDKEFDSDEMDRKVTRSEDRSKYKKVQPNDLVYNMMRAWQGGFGAVAVNGMVSPAYVVAHPKIDLVADYYENVLRTPKAIEQMRRYSRGVTDFRLRLYWEEFKNIKLPVPPIVEMNAICDHLLKVAKQFDELTKACLSSIEILQERRVALISNAITGQIDVRQY